MINTYDFKISHPEMFSQLSVRDMLFLHYKCPQVERHVKLFTHYNEIIYTLGGIKTLMHGGKSFEMTENKSLFVRKTAYAQEMHEVVGWEVLCFYFPDEFLLQVFREYRKDLAIKNLPSPPADMLVEIKVNDTTRTFFYGIVPYFTQQPAPPERLLELKFKELLYNIFSDPDNAPMLAYIAGIEDQRVTPIWQVMEANYMFNLTIAEFSRMAQRSVPTFKRDFFKHYQTTPGKWLAEKRLTYANQLLLTSNKNVSEVAYDSGFENLTHFSRVFKEKYGHSPLHYRKQQIKAK